MVQTLDENSGLGDEDMDLGIIGGQDWKDLNQIPQEEGTEGGEVRATTEKVPTFKWLKEEELVEEAEKKQPDN